MKLRITTPLTVVVDDDQVSSLRAEDAKKADAWFRSATSEIFG